MHAELYRDVRLLAIRFLPEPLKDPPYIRWNLAHRHTSYVQFSIAYMHDIDECKHILIAVVQLASYPPKSSPKTIDCGDKACPIPSTKLRRQHRRCNLLGHDGDCDQQRFRTRRRTAHTQSR